jgi:hypothetical protein
MHTFHPDPGSAAGIPNVPTTVVTKRRLTVPLWGSGESAAAAHALRSSTYGRVYQLARRVTAGAPTPYDAVKRVEHYLRTNYTYSETPPRRSYPLRAFLFRDGIGYCQQFSGAMALMLREIGIPARVADGFSPGTRGKDGAYVIRDEDAHSWVEVYFNGIGWVPFDPTPAAAPARREAASLGIRSPNAPPTGLAKSQQLGAPIDPGTPSPRARAGSSLPPAWLVLLAAAVVGAALAAARSLRRAARYRALAPAAAAESQLRELASALARVRSWSTRGSTLLELERRLATVVGPASAAYAAALRRARYGRGAAPPPSPAERRALRRELAAGSGTRGRLRALPAIPPLAPAAEGAGPATDG